MRDSRSWLGPGGARNPLALVALAAILGIGLVEVGWGAWIPIFAGFTLIWVLLRPALWRLLLAAGLVYGAVHETGLQETTRHPLRALLKPGQRVTAVVIGEFQRVAIREDAKSGRQQVILRASEIQLPTRRVAITGLTGLRVWIDTSSTDVSGGIYELKGSLSLVQRPWNPALFDPVQTALRQGIVGEFSPQQSRCMSPRFSLRLVMLRLAADCREWIERQLAMGMEDQEMPRTLVTTMALGTAESDVTGLEKPFRNSGTLHVFAVSGLHVGLLAAIGWAFLRCTGLRRTGATAVLIPLLFGYAFITGWVPSAARAAFMAAILLTGPLLNRQSRLLNSLGAAALILLAGDSLQLFQVGFQLSFGVLAAIAVGTPWLARPLEPLTELDPFLPPSLANWRQNFSMNIRRHCASLLTTSTAAWLGSAPLMIHHFHACTPVSVVANGLLVPLSFLSLLTVALSLVSALFHLTWLQVCFNHANWLWAHLMLASATGFSALPGGHFPLSPASLKPAPMATLSVLSMPPGEGAQVLSSGGQTWLLDCGGVQHHRRNILPFLRREDVAHIDGLVLSHADADHAGAAVKLAESWGCPQVMMGLHEPWRLDSRATSMWQMHEVAERGGRRMASLRAGDHVQLGEMKMLVMYPAVMDKHDKADDRTLIARLDGAGFRVLWCNDAGFVAEKALLERWSPADLRCDVLLRNQHVSDWCALPEFLLAVRPQVVVSSNSPAIATERMPAHLMSHCQRYGMHLFDQSVCGMVQLVLEPDQLQISAWLTDESVTLRR